jgi:GT2 family glycosyltransferase
VNTELTADRETDRPRDMIRNLAGSLVARPVLQDVTVVIPTLGRPILESCLRWLADGSHWPEQIIVVDQGCSSQVADWLDMLHQAGLKTAYVPSAQSGRSAGLNRGLEQVTTRFLAMTDDDCFVAADWLEKMVLRLRREPETILTGRVELAGNEESAFSVVTSREPKLYTRAQLKVHPFIGGNAGLAMELVRRIGYFDEHPCLASAEDNDYGYRALKLGIPIRYDPEVVLYHFHWRNADARADRYAEYAYSQGGFYGTHLRHGDGLILLQTVRDLVRSPLRWLRGITSGDKELVANGRAHTLHLLPGLIAGLRRNDR